MKRNCDACAKPYEAKTARSKYCKRAECVRARERSRARRRRGAEVVELKPRSKEQPDQDEAAPEPPEDHRTTYAAALRELQAAGKVDTALGQAALRLAARIDYSAADTGSSLASMVRQLQQTLAAATADASIDGDPIDELKARREARQRGA